ncbi:CDF family Co(II)/Ni(II) efflux transporter DmeF [Kamptonema animale CS-326]|jgi:cation diffusion facilitator family transporter|uniref:CDF family Co(II)/Ni(II) efflux transporter DmeF n=1 Tax=Kamptonema animale TaxID=92934 RepID=UPI00232E8F30|nr:CDF family Co(II)/Ni(II) efflux transporter DmeF [Kamptonema animale]MDB9510690.1 CDF family Co(II)/Ni(II) efflux transporter DmeF [Kamptonema animale CS-326]
MHIHNLEQWQHSHDFSVNQDRAEKNTKIVMLLTAVTMVAEIVAGTIFGSMSLLADGWHMATHVAAFGITVFAYQYARSHATDPKYTFGTGKVSVLGGFASAIALAVIALIMALESGARLFQPQSIQFNEAIGVAIIGLTVNLVSAWLLQDHHDHHHDRHHDHHQDHHQDHHHDHHHDRDDHDRQDHNLRAAYLHVLADALTSVFAIVALFSGKLLGWVWMDAVMGLVGAGVIAKWSYGLIRDTGLILVDGAIDKRVKLDIVTAIEEDADNRVTDLHIWHIGQNHLAATISLVTHHPQTPEFYKNLLSHIPSLSHVLVEVNHCHDDPNVAEHLHCEV